jgi:predicted enzyme related to lactoylglutathione lyase
MTSKENAINWFELSVSDIKRATDFYETIFGISMEQRERAGMKISVFPAGNMSGKVSGSLVESPRHKPSADGAKIYLNANPDLSGTLTKVEKAGGRINMPKTLINDEVGYLASFTDTEGNTVALHSIN